MPSPISSNYANCAFTHSVQVFDSARSGRPRPFRLHSILWMDVGSNEAQTGLRGRQCARCRLRHQAGGTAADHRAVLVLISTGAADADGTDHIPFCIAAQDPARDCSERNPIIGANGGHGEELC